LISGLTGQLGGDAGQLPQLPEQHVLPVGGAVSEHGRADAHDEPDLTESGGERVPDRHPPLDRQPQVHEQRAEVRRGPGQRLNLAAQGPQSAQQLNFPQ